MKNDNMTDTHISVIVSSVCKKLGISYSSVNPYYTEIINDAEKLKDIYLQLKEIIGDLQVLEEKYKVEGLSKLLEDDIHKLDEIDHDIIRLAHRLRSQA